MIDIGNQHLINTGTKMPIKRWVVWFMSPWGLHDKIEDAIVRCKANDVDPELNIVPTPVATTDGSYYEIFFARR